MRARRLQLEILRYWALPDRVPGGLSPAIAVVAGCLQGQAAGNFSANRELQNEKFCPFVPAFHLRLNCVHGPVKKTDRIGDLIYPAKFTEDSQSVPAYSMRR